MSGQRHDNAPGGAVCIRSFNSLGVVMGSLDSILNEMTAGAVKNIPKIVNGPRFNGELTAHTRDTAYDILIGGGGLGGKLWEVHYLADAIKTQDVTDMYQAEYAADTLTPLARRLRTIAGRALGLALDDLIDKGVIVITETDHQIIIMSSDGKATVGTLEGFEELVASVLAPVDRRYCPRGGQTAAYMMAE